MPSSACKTCARSEEHTSELQSHDNLVCRLLLEKKINSFRQQVFRSGTLSPPVGRRSRCAWTLQVRVGDEPRLVGVSGTDILGHDFFFNAYGAHRVQPFSPA